MYEILEKIKEIGIIPVVKIDDAKDAVPLAGALIKGGLPCAEITFRTSAAKEAIASIKKAYPDMLVGAGTVLNSKMVDDAIEAGAEFIVSPGLNPDTVKYCQSKNIPVFPGIATAGEMETAISLGLETVKFFPAETIGGVKQIKALSGPFPNMMFIPTGGINGGNVKQYLDFKKVVACGGSWMVDSKLISAGEFDKIEALVREAKEKLQPPKAEIHEKSINIKPKNGKKAKVVTMGEIMLRLSTPGNSRFLQADTFDVCYGGGEANVAVSLANFGYDASYVTKVPNNPIGDCAVAALRKMNVSTENIARGGNRLGIYFLETGAAMRASNVIYDRANSAIAEANPEDFDFDKIFGDADWFHFTGITPALGEKATKLTELACIYAKKHGLTVSVDLNFRKKLWSSEKAQEVMTRLMKYVDVCIGNEEDAEKVLGFKPGKSNVTGGSLDLDGYKDIFGQMIDKFGFKYVVSSLRESRSASDNGWSGCVYDGKEFYHSRKYDIHIVDRVGGGDAFAAGFICGILDCKNMKEALEFGVAASALKHTIPGDFNMVSRSEVDALVGGDASGRVSR